MNKPNSKPARTPLAQHNTHHKAAVPIKKTLAKENKVKKENKTRPRTPDYQKKQLKTPTKKEDNQVGGLVNPQKSRSQTLKKTVTRTPDKKTSDYSARKST